MDNILEIKKLSVEYYRGKKVIPAVRDLSLELKAGEILGIVGESGCGKSTLGFSILKLISENEGRIKTGEILLTENGGKIDILKSSQSELQKIRGGKISMIFQDPFASLNPVLKIGEQIAETMKIHQLQIADYPPSFLRKLDGGIFNKLQIKEKVLEILSQVKIDEPERIYNSYPHQLSGGLRQRVMIAIALASKPKVLIADEPTTALDVTTQKEILLLLKSLQKEFGMSVILITHNFGILSDFAKKISVMYAGEIVEEAKFEDIILSPKHPYTKGLIETVINFEEGKKGKLKTIPGSIPDMWNLPSGCPFHPRCERILDKCKESNPEIKKENGRLVKCFNPI